MLACIATDLATGAVARVEDHPVRRLYDAGVPITLNTDDPAMFGCTLTGEYRLAAREFHERRQQRPSPLDSVHAIFGAVSEITMIDPRKQAHRLIDRLPETQLSALVGLLETIVDPAAVALREAPIDDEPERANEKQDVVARDWLARRGGKGIPHAEAMRRLGLE